MRMKRRSSWMTPFSRGALCLPRLPTDLVTETMIAPETETGIGIERETGRGRGNERETDTEVTEVEMRRGVGIEIATEDPAEGTI